MDDIYTYTHDQKEKAVNAVYELRNISLKYREKWNESEKESKNKDNRIAELEKEIERLKCTADAESDRDTSRIKELESLLREACDLLAQSAYYGKVEFLHNDKIKQILKGGKNE